MSEKHNSKKKVKKPVKKKRKKRSDWLHNDQLIEDAFCQALIEKQKMPTYAEVARRLRGIDEKTVQRHLSEINFEERFKIFRAGSQKVVANLYKHAATGKNDKMIRMWLELFEGLGEKKKIEHTINKKEINFKDAE